MTDVFSFHQGNTPLLVSIPHDGREIPSDIAARMTEAGLAIPDTDWHVKRLYEVAESLGASIIAANYSRYVVDLNRSPEDEVLYEGQVSTGLCPVQTFAGDPIYREGYAPDAAEIERRLEKYWDPYHRQIRLAIADLRTDHGHAALWDAHSIRSEVPRLFGGTLPELNFGSNDGRSCRDDVLQSMMEGVKELPYTAVANARFKGGYITRHYGRPGKCEYAMQLEVAQRCYMDEATLDYDEARAGEFSKLLYGLLVLYEAAVLHSDTRAQLDFLARNRPKRWSKRRAKRRRKRK